MDGDSRYANPSRDDYAYPSDGETTCSSSSDERDPATPSASTKSSPTSTPTHTSTSTAPSSSFESVSQFFHLPIRVAAERMGMGVTTLKQQCRRTHGIVKWPYRQYKRLNTRLGELETKKADLMKRMDETWYNQQGSMQSAKGVMLINPRNHTALQKLEEQIEKTRQEMREMRQSDGSGIANALANRSDTRGGSRNSSQRSKGNTGSGSSRGSGMKKGGGNQRTNRRTGSGAHGGGAGGVDEVPGHARIPERSPPLQMGQTAVNQTMVANPMGWPGYQGHSMGMINSNYGGMAGSGAHVPSPSSPAFLHGFTTGTFISGNNGDSNIIGSSSNTTSSRNDNVGETAPAMNPAHPGPVSRQVADIAQQAQNNISRMYKLGNGIQKRDHKMLRSPSMSNLAHQEDKKGYQTSSVAPSPVEHINTQGQGESGDTAEVPSSAGTSSHTSPCLPPFRSLFSPITLTSMSPMDSPMSFSLLSPTLPSFSLHQRSSSSPFTEWPSPILNANGTPGLNPLSVESAPPPWLLSPPSNPPSTSNYNNSTPGQNSSYWGKPRQDDMAHYNASSPPSTSNGPGSRRRLSMEENNLGNGGNRALQYHYHHHLSPSPPPPPS